MLSPAGDWECARAAVENGADAIYFGLDRFNARMRANNFTEADLPPLMKFLHRRGVRGYVTLNTLVFEDELEGAEQYLRSMIAAGVDAVIVQDVGLCRLIRQLSPDFPIHASTQMTITSAAGVEFARDLGCQLVVLARELSIQDIGRIQSAFHAPDSAPRAPGSPLPLEVFVHGALCVAYSGQCLTSESLGGRSANRGECAQACRMPYELIADGHLVPLGDRRYLLSPQDLAGLEVLPDLARVGVASLKIEGRLKSPEYVANITRIYRQALDGLGTASAERGTGNGERGIPSETSTPRSPLPVPRYEMEMAFSRGLYTGWFGGVNNQELVHARFGKKRGVYLGEVTAVGRDRVSVRLEGPLKPGDGVVFDAGRPEEPEEGGRVYEVRRPTSDVRSGESVLTFANNAIDFSRVRAGDRLWKTSDPALERRWRQSFEGDRPRFQRPLAMAVHGLAGQPLTLIARDELGHVARTQSSMPLSPADKQALATDRLRDQLGRLGGTPFRLGELTNHLEGNLILPVSELNRLRREVVSQLEQQRAQPKRWTLDKPVAPSARATASSVSPAAAAELSILVRNLAQLERALRCGAQIVYCDFENPKKYRDAVATFRAWQLATQGCGEPRADDALPVPPSALYVAPPRIFKPGEDWQLEQVRSCQADGYLVRNYDHLRFFSGERCIGDFSLNVANHLSAAWFIERFGLERLTASYDLNVQQLEALLRGAPPERFEITLHQHMPMFHMEHCVFCAFLSKGKDYRDCGRPCDTREVKLRDRVGAEHPVKADVGCRNTVFNARAQTGAEYLDRMLALGARHFRIEFLNETPEEVERTIAMYRRLLRGEVTGAQLWKELRLFNQLGVTRGTVKG
ncbi:MAG: U32 family peptidase [Verrucomicrobia bacterium]|nr:U32 family peptidase [Verrucomicrobiota bacterium]